MLFYYKNGEEKYEFLVIGCKSTVIVNGNDVAFDYINTYFELEEAIKEAKLVSEDENVLEVSVHHWILKEDGTQEHVESEYGHDDIPYMFLNINHRELRLKET